MIQAARQATLSRAAETRLVFARFLLLLPQKKARKSSNLKQDEAASDLEKVFFFRENTSRNLPGFEC